MIMIDLDYISDTRYTHAKPLAILSQCLPQGVAAEIYAGGAKQTRQQHGCHSRQYEIHARSRYVHVRILNAIAVSPPIAVRWALIFQRKLTAAHTTVATSVRP